MIEYLEYLAETVPVISTRQTVINISQMGNTMGDMIYLENGYKTEWQQNWTEDYMGILNRYADDRKNNIPSVVFIACDSIELAKKCSAILSMYRQKRVGTYCYVDDDDYSVYEYEEEDDDNRAPDCLVINMSVSLQPSNGMPHDYIMLTCPQNSPNCAMFYNIAGDDDLQLKVQALDMCTANFTIICIDESQINAPWVLDIIRRKNADVIKIPALSDEYYEKLASDFLDNAGVRLEKGFSTLQLVKRARIRMGDKLSEETVCWLIGRAISRSTDKTSVGEKVIKRADFKELDFDESSAAEELESMIGLKAVKMVVEEWCAVTSESMNNKKLSMIHKNMIFTGRSGNGKTTMARMIAKIMAENGVSNGHFSECSRSDLIGKYLGHTAPKVAAKFEAARSGVLFVDEAGFFVKDRNDSFLEEALKEFVRYMEVYPDVMVIFAMYDNEVDEFLEKDIGLRSRISEIVHFDDYTLDELWLIENKMLSDMGYTIDLGCREIFDCYMDPRMKNQDFGNAREARRLSEACVKAVCVRHMKLKNSRDKHDMKVKKCDMERAVQRLGTDNKKSDTVCNPIGFLHNLQGAR